MVQKLFFNEWDKIFSKENVGQDLMNTNGSVDFMISIQKGNLQCKVCLAFSSLLGELYVLGMSVKFLFYDQFSLSDEAQTCVMNQ